MENPLHKQSEKAMLELATLWYLKLLQLQLQAKEAAPNRAQPENPED